MSFPTCLDRLFGVQYVKNRFGLDHRLRDLLRERCRATINSIQQRTNEHECELVLMLQTPTAEERSSALRGLYKRPPPEEQERLKRELAAAKKARIEKVKKEEEDPWPRPRRRSRQRSWWTKPSGIKAAEENLKAAEERKDERVKAIRNRFQNDHFMRKFLEPIPGGDLYALRDYHDEIWVIVNQDSEFFKSLYQNATAHAERQALLDLMIFSIAHAEAARANSEGMKRFWKETRAKILGSPPLCDPVQGLRFETSTQKSKELDEAYANDPQSSLENGD